MKKVLFVANNMLGGGAEKVLITILNSLNKSKFDINLVLIKNKGIRLDEIPCDIPVKYIYDVTELDKIFPKDKKSVKKLYNSVISENYDVEIAFLEGPPTYLLSCSENQNSKKYAWVHVDLAAYPWSQVYYETLDAERNAYQKFNKIIFVSQSNLESFQKKFLVDTKLQVLFNPINTLMIRQQANEYKIYEHRFMFCYVASISKHKGQDKIIFALKQLIDDGFDCCLYLVGEGPNREEFIQLSEKLGIRHRIVFTGYHKNPYPFIKAADVFVHASDGEGFPLVLCESLILHTPIVATNCNGSNDVLENGKYGILTEISSSALYEAMKLLIQDKDKRRYYSRLGKSWSKKYVFEEKLKYIEELLEE